MRAERDMDTNYKQPAESFNTYNKNQTTLGEHEHGKQCEPAPLPGHLQDCNRANSSGKRPAHMENTEKKY